MSWFYEIKQKVSVKNGAITCRRICGYWEVMADGYRPTGRYAVGLFKNALKRIPKNTSIKNVLVLGLAGGAVIKVLRTRWPKSKITLVEPDQIMVEIGRELGLFKEDDSTRVIVGDAFEIMAKTQQHFDLIIVDIFHGEVVDTGLADSTQVTSMVSCLSRRGFLILNAFNQPQLGSAFQKQLSKTAWWKYKNNWLGLFRRFGNGQIGDPLPDGFVYYRSCLEYVQGESRLNAQVEWLGEDGQLGVRFGWWPFIFERYDSDVEPVRAPYKSSRWFLWQQIRDARRPKGWWPSLLDETLSGFCEIKDSLNYWRNWDEHAKRHRLKWLKEQQYVIEEVSLDEFVTNYRQVGKLSSFMINLFVKMLRNHHRASGEKLHLFAARDPKSGELVSGLAVLDTPSINQSHHLIAFIKDAATHTSIGVGLIDRWYRHAIQNKLRFLNFGLFWSPGHPKSMQGFSRFKGQFDIYYLLCPKPIMRLVRKIKNNN